MYLHNMDSRVKRTNSLTETTSQENSDTDEVIDFLHINDLIIKSNPEKTKIHVTNEFNKNYVPFMKASTTASSTTIINLDKSSENNCTKMIPTINVTPHSPATTNKYSNLFEDTLIQLQNIRESVVKMKNSSIRFIDGFHNSSVLSTSLPNLTTMNKNVDLYNNGMGIITSGATKLNTPILMWSPQQHQYFLNTDRRKSWTTTDDPVVSGDCTNKSISLSSLDSEEQETIRGAEQRRRNTRNSVAGVSTHSLNEAELVRDFDKIAGKRSLVTETITRIPLQKSISTSSIVAKDDLKGISRHLTDSEDENQGLLRAHAKIEVYDNVEKRRKRGSIFFRKKKDKCKIKLLNNSANDAILSMDIGTTCEICGATIGNNGIMKDHQLECAKVKKFISVQKINFITSGVKKHQTNEVASDFYDGGGSVLDYNADEAPLIRAEFLSEPPIEAHDLGADPVLGIELEEHDSWSPGVGKELLKSLQEKQIKRQEHIYEFIMTEKHHCQTLLVMQKVFVESLERHFSGLNVNAMFPRLAELSLLHCDFLRQLRKKQRANIVVESIADILLDFFGSEKSQKLRQAYGEFCANHRSALEQFKNCMTSRDIRFAQWYKHCLTNPLLKKKGIPECILFVTQRLTKYPLLIEPLLKSARENNEEFSKLQQALNMVKSLLVDVDACVAEKELSERQVDLVQRVDAKSFSIFRHKPFRKSDLSIEAGRRLKFEGLASLLQGRSKVQLVLVVVLTDCLCFLVENSSHKYTFFTPEHKAGVVPLQKLLIREKAGTESRGIYLISSNPEFPEMYELKVQQPKDKQVWIQSIRQAVLNSTLAPLSTEDSDHYLKYQEQQSGNKEQRQEIIDQLRQKDVELALLLEEKLQLHLKSCSKLKSDEGIQNQQQEDPLAAQFLSVFKNVSYRDLMNTDTDSGILWQRVQIMVEEVIQLASMMHQSVTGLQVNCILSEKGNTFVNSFTSPILPKRAETFAGFDEKRAKLILSNNKLVATQQKLTPRLQELEENRQNSKTLHNVEYHHQLELNTHKDDQFTIVQIANNLHTLLNIISQQMTTIEQLKLQIANNRENPRDRTLYTHNDQLEELRNLQDKLQEEKTAWTKHLQQQKQELEERRLSQLQLHEAIKHEQEDIKQQREQLYRKMELLSSQGLLISPNTMIVSPVLNANHDVQNHTQDVDGFGSPTTSTIEKRKDKWRANSVSAKTAPNSFLSASNAPKTNQQAMKQKIPIKLSSLSSVSVTSSGQSTLNKIDKSASFSVNNSNGINIGGVTQLFPLKLADKISSPIPSNPLASTCKSFSNPQVQHTRTGSSPAIIQQHAIVANKPIASSNNIKRSVTNSAPINSIINYTSIPTTNKTHTQNVVDNTIEEQEIYF